MKPKIIGIIGGAGPLAGAYLLKRVLVLSNRQYGCYRDKDYPQVFLNSFPFSDMLGQKKDEKGLKAELSLSLNQLRTQGAEVIAIACNTLHNFLEDDQNREDLINLPSLLGTELANEKTPLVFCTTTSRENNLHKNYLDCIYPEPFMQKKVDEMIDRILFGAEDHQIIKDLRGLIEQSNASTIILGCTELSLFTKKLIGSPKKIIDPLEILAKKILEKSFTSTS